MFSKIKTVTSTTDCSRQIAEAHELIASAECIIIGAGAGLSTAAGLRYDGPEFEHRFTDFIQKYGISDLYSSSFYPFQTEEEYWACWARHRIPSSLVPHCPIDGEKMAVHVRCDEYFVEDGNWQAASERYYQFLEHASKRRSVLLELGVGFNTPSIIRFPFERMAAAWKDTHLVRINQKNTQSMLDNSRTIAIRKDISEVL